MSDAALATESLVSARQVEITYRLRHGTVAAAIAAGEMPAQRRKPRRGKVAFYVRLADARARWGAQ